MQPLLSNLQSFGINPMFSALLDTALLALLSVIAYRDAKTSEIPDRMNLALLVLAVLNMLLTTSLTSQNL
jgi:Flp pilus assembly protein protease CpaA